MSLSYTLGDTHIFTASKKVEWKKGNGGNLKTGNQPLSPQEINHRIGRYAGLAGLESQGVTAEYVQRTYKELGQHTVIALVQDILANRNARPVRWKRVDRDIRLHGIGRRSG